ncbi:coadhesin-like isoform X2 [Corticium candelabrum]|nr:coadhesin-like isoform X2 [Corticium candelabrum]
MLLLTTVTIVLSGLSSLTSSTATCNCTGFGNCMWSSWSTQSTGGVSLSADCMDGVSVWRACSCNGSCYDTKCELYSCGAWDMWGSWTGNCGPRTRIRIRSCATTSNVLYSNVNVTMDSDMQPTWMAWAEWSQWSCKSSERERTRTRQCYEKRCASDSDHYSSTCPSFFSSEAQTVSWSAWSLWSQWTASCGNRVRHQRRNCTLELCTPPTSCNGQSNQTDTDTNPPCCPVSATWLAWTNWQEWSATCGNRTRTRRRTCNTQAVSCGGLASCSGLAAENVTDSTPSCCPVDAVWTGWSSWSMWSKTCDTRMKQRTRVCLAALCGGNNKCVGSSQNVLNDVNYPTCPIATSTQATVITRTSPPHTSTGSSMSGSTPHTSTGSSMSGSTPHTSTGSSMSRSGQSASYEISTIGDSILSPSTSGTTFTTTSNDGTQYMTIAATTLASEGLPNAVNASTTSEGVQVWVIGVAAGGSVVALLMATVVLIVVMRSRKGKHLVRRSGTSSNSLYLQPTTART